MELRACMAWKSLHGMEEPAWHGRACMAWKSLHGGGESKVQTNFQCPHVDQSKLHGCEWINCVRS